MVDTHSHIYGPEFDEDRDEVIERALKAGIEKIFLPNINEESVPRMLSLAETYPDVCYPMTGLHPEDVKDDWESVLERIRPNLSRSVAVGETGLDFYWDSTFKQQQLDAFECQIGWAKEHDLPLVIHMRKAEQEILDIMDAHKQDGLRGVFHCFGGSRETAQRLLRHEGFVLGIGGVLTFKNCRLGETLGYVPLDRLVLETDSPYLSPVPFRGKRNEPSYVRYVSQFVANLYGVSEDEVNVVTNATVRRIFGDL